jgi:glycosyltransferase involved in cell wall biosynthesis
MPDRRLRILIVGPFPPPIGGGVATFMLNLIGSYLDARHDFVRFTTSRPAKRNVVANWGYGALINAGIGRLLLGALVTAWHVLLFPFAVLRHRIDLVQVQASAYHTFWEAMAYVLMARALGRPTLMRLGGETDEFYDKAPPRVRRWIEAGIRRPDVLIVQSAYWRDFAARLGRQQGVVVLGNFVPNVPDVARTDPGNEPPLFLFSAGTEALRKGYDVLLDAIEAMRQDDATVRFRFIAAPPRVVEEIAARGLAEVVETTGTLQHAEMVQQYLACDAFVLPSRAEGFPNAMLEAMATGLPVVATPVGAIPDVLQDGVTGFIVPVGDAAALRQAIETLAGDASLRQRMGQAARQHVLQTFTPEQVLPVLDRAYERLAG